MDTINKKDILAFEIELDKVIEKAQYFANNNFGDKWIGYEASDVVTGKKEIAIAIRKLKEGKKHAHAILKELDVPIVQRLNL